MTDEGNKILDVLKRALHGRRLKVEDRMVITQLVDQCTVGDLGSEIDLRLVETDALVAELKKRTPSGICVYAYADEGGEKFAGRYWGSTFWRSGILESMAREHRRRTALMMLPDSEDKEEEQ
jgi:hypothetical protein